jgi:predicted Zn-dependent peptidase
MSDEELAEVEVAQAKKLDRINVEDIDIPTVPGTVVKTKVLNDSISEVLLSNGIKVVLMKQPTEHHLIHFMIRRPQGFSMLNDDDINYHDMLGSCLRKFSCYNGQSNVVVEAFDDTYDHTAKWEPGDKLNKFRVESTLKMLYKSLTTNEIDSVEFAEQKQKLQASAVTLSAPMTQSALKVGLMLVADTKRLMPPSAEVISDYNIDHFREIVRDYYSNYNGSVMVVQGEVEADSIMPLILKYVGALPSKPERVRRFTWPADHYKTENTVMTEKIENPTPICQTLLFYTWEKGFEYTLQSHAHNEVLKSVLGNLLMQTLRVQHSDVYTPQVQMEDALLPVPHLKYTITYACNPTQRERIAEDVKRIVQDMAEGDLITQDLIDGYVKSREKQQEAYKGNEYTKRRDYLTQELNGIVVKDGDLTYIRQVTPKSLKDHVKQLLKKGNLHVGYLTTE